MTALEVREKLKSYSNEKIKASLQRFFKTPIKSHGVKSKDVSKVVKDTLKLTAKNNKSEVFKLAEELYKTGYCEEAWVASALVNSKQEDFLQSDFKKFESWIDSYIDDWAKCDGFCNHTVWAILEKYPELLSNLNRWAVSKNLWLRRAAAVSLILPAKQGKLLKESLEIANILLIDPEDMVQKGYGWLLKEQSRKNEKIIFDFVFKNKKIMPRTALRYAIELMPKELKIKAMEK